MKSTDGGSVAEEAKTTPDVARAARSDLAVSYLFMHKSWRERQVDHWSYDGDAQWTRHMSFDICIPETCREVLKDRKGEFWLVPLFEVPKGTTFSSFDLRNQANRALKLKHGSVSSLMVVTALVGAMEEARVQDPSAPSLSPNLALRSFLYDLFDSTLPLKDQDGNTLNPQDGDYPSKIRQAAVDQVRRAKSLSDVAKERFAWHRTNLDAIERDFVSMFDSSSLFRWFVLNYTYNELYCVKIDEYETIIKCAYRSSRDLFRRGDMHHPGSPFCYFDVPLDFVSTSEVGAVTVDAPEGMLFIPNFNPHHTGQRGKRLQEMREAYAVNDQHSMRRVFANRWLQISDRIPSGANGRNTTLIGFGSLSPTRANFRGVKSLWAIGNSSSLAEPLRRIPVHGEARGHRYVIELMMIPAFGTRITRYFIVLLMCLALFGVDILCAGEVTNMNVQTVTSLAPIITLITASMDGAGYIRRVALKIPTYLTHATVLLGVPLLLWFAAANASQNYDLARNVATVGAIGTFAALLCFLAWCHLVWSIKRSWDKQEESYGSFPVGI